MESQKEVESRLARIEENIGHLQEWRDACALLPITVAELVQWKRDQNGDLRQMREDIRCLREQFAMLKGSEKVLKWLAALLLASVITQVVEWVFAILRSGTI